MRVTSAPIVSYSCPESCLGVVKIEGTNAFETVNLKTGKHTEWRLLSDPPVTPGGIFAGYVLEMRVKQMIGGLALEEPSKDLPYHIVRGKDRSRPEYFPVLNSTYDDGEDRPVLANNCRNTIDDKDTVCDGGTAIFLQERADAKPRR